MAPLTEKQDLNSLLMELNLNALSTKIRFYLGSEGNFPRLIKVIGMSPSKKDETNRIHSQYNKLFVFVSIAIRRKLFTVCYTMHGKNKYHINLCILNKPQYTLMCLKCEDDAYNGQTLLIKCAVTHRARTVWGSNAHFGHGSLGPRTRHADLYSLGHMVNPLSGRGRDRDTLSHSAFHLWAACDCVPLLLAGQPASHPANQPTSPKHSTGTCDRGWKV